MGGLLLCKWLSETRQGIKPQSLKSQGKAENELMWSGFDKEDEGTCSKTYTKAMACGSRCAKKKNIVVGTHGEDGWLHEAALRQCKTWNVGGRRKRKTQV